MEEKDKIKILKEAEQAIKMCKVISNKSFKDFNRYWIRQDKAFQKYSQCYCFSNEILKEYYNRINFSNKDVLTVCGSGDQIIESLARGARKVDSFDSNKLTYYNLYLKIAAIKALKYDEFIKFYNLYSKDNKKYIYTELRDAIKKEDIKLFWDKFFQNDEELFTTFFLGEHNNKNIESREESAKISLTQAKNNISYLEEDTFKDVKKKINEDSITFKEMDIFDVKKKYNNKYDFINFSNIFNYIDTKKFISYIKQLLEDNLYNDGEIILDYIWEYSEKFQSFAIFLMDLYELNPNIITFNNNYNGNDAVVVKKKKEANLASV